MGQVLTAGAGQMPARQAAAKAGIPMTTPSLNINKVCLSGVESIILADQFVRSGAFDVVVAGGMESMSQAPHLLPGSRGGYKYGDVTLVDHMALDGLHDAFTDQPMGLLTEAGNDVDVIAREQQDAFAVRSHELAAKAWDTGVFDDEVVAVEIAGRRGQSTGCAGTKACAPTPRSSVSRNCRRRSAPTAPSPPATRRRSTTAPARWW